MSGLRARQVIDRQAAVGHDVERCEAVLRSVVERSRCRLCDVAVTNASEQQPEAVALEGLRHERAQAERDGADRASRGVVAGVSSESTSVRP